MRLDRFLCELNIGSRSQIKGFVRQGLVSVNGVAARDAGQQIDELSDEIAFRGRRLCYQPFIYYMLNKPEGVVSATADRKEQTVVSLLGDRARDDIFPVGRLDKDTTGLLLLTNDGELAHRLLSPKRHVDKTYQVNLAHALTAEDIRRLETGLDIGEERPTLPARAAALDKTILLLTLHEGKFHQVKRMLQAVGNEVLALKRVCFGGLSLDESLEPGQYRELTAEEVAQLRRAAP